MRFSQTAGGGTKGLCWAVLTALGLGAAAFGITSSAFAVPPGSPVPQSMPAQANPTATVTPPSTPAPLAAPYAPPVRIYALNGVDPFGFGGLREMVDRLSARGYGDTRFGGWYQRWQFEREVRRLHSQQPDMQFAIIGYSFGVYQAKAMANRLTRDGIPVSMVGYIGGDYLRNVRSDVPVGPRVVNVRGNGFLPTGRNLFFTGADLDGADNMRLRANHFDLPKQQQTLDAMLAGLSNSPVGSQQAGAYPGPSYIGTPSPAAAISAAPPGAIHANPAPRPDTVSQPRNTSNSRPVFRMVGRGER